MRRGLGVNIGDTHLCPNRTTYTLLSISPYTLEVENIMLKLLAVSAPRKLRCLVVETGINKIIIHINKEFLYLIPVINVTKP